MLEFVLRDMVEDDRNFVFNSYLKSYRENYPIYWTPQSLYFNPQREILEFLLRSATISVACYPEDPQEILGYIIYAPHGDVMLLHYVYARRQREGFGRAMLLAVIGDSQLIIASHICNSFSKLRDKLSPRRMVYDHFLLNKLWKLAA